jgi:aldose 1-epimerase
VPDKDGQLADVVLGFDTLGEYEEKSPYFGCITGRYANRIARGTFELEGKTYHLTTNEGLHHLHGGARGFDRVLWEAEPFIGDRAAGLRLRYNSASGEEGYPGNLAVQLSYSLTQENRFLIEFEATTDQATPVNLCNHSYFNLGGPDTPDILDHRLLIDADAYTPILPDLLPTGKVRPVAGTPFDFRKMRRIGDRIGAADPQLRIAGGYDHNFVLNRQGGERMALVARLAEPLSGRLLEVRSTEPGVQFYSGNGLDGSVRGKGRRLGPRSGLCLETQHFPDSPNQAAFPSVILSPGETYRSLTSWSFSTHG